jgi:hypothetical protein
VPSYETRVLDSWDAYLKVITDSPYANWAFRGQGDAAWPLSSTLTRYFAVFRIPQSDWVRREQRSLRIFKRKATHFLADIPAREDDFQWLALMQHHGSPTRLLDFTWSPYVAAFFALERAEGDSAVWALNAAALPSITPLSGPPFTLEMLNAGQAAVGDQVGIGEPYIMNRRLIAQSGTFVVPSAVGLPIEAQLHDPQITLAKFVLPRDRVRERASHELYRMNITHATLFPDLDGLARSLAYELEIQRRR